jgi:hypothetical protein
MKENTFKMEFSYVILTGGLGNQMFQIAAGLNRSGENLLVSDCIGKPRSSENHADLFDFHFKSRVKYHSCKKNNYFKNKLFNYMLSTGLTVNYTRKTIFFNRVVHLLSIVTFSIHFRSIVIPKISQGLGFDKDLVLNKGDILIGYCQTYRWVEDKFVAEIFKASKPNVLDSQLAYYKNCAFNKEILVVHLRLTDYRLEKNFGILGREYYNKAIDWHFSKKKYDEIWLFSDELELAEDIIPNKFKGLVAKVPEISDSPALTLEAMRFGTGYIIGNSTYSWWGAALSYSSNPLVVAPLKWFKNQPEPQSLIPSQWYRVKNEFN